MCLSSSITTEVFSSLTSVSAIPDRVFVLTSAVSNNVYHRRLHSTSAMMIRLYSPRGVPMREVANPLGVSLGFVHTMVWCHQRFIVTNPPPRFCGRHRVLDGGDLSSIRAITDAQPFIHLDELHEHRPAAVHGVQVSLASRIFDPLIPWHLKAMSRVCTRTNAKTRTQFEEWR